jgi:hypothetical protein
VARISGDHRSYLQIGNAVPPRLAKVIGDFLNMITKGQVEEIKTLNVKQLELVLNLS